MGSDETIWFDEKTIKTERAKGGSMGNQSKNQPYVSDFGHTLHRGSP